MLFTSTSKFIVLLFLCQFYFTNCNVTKTNKVAESSNAIDGEWSLIKFHTSNIEIDRSNKSFIPTLEIQTNEKKIEGRDGCNRIYAGLLELSDTVIKASMIGGTKVGCKMEKPYDEEYRNLLRATRTYKINESTLILFDSQDVMLLEFERIKE